MLARALDAPVHAADVKEIGFEPLRPLPAADSDPLLSVWSDGDMVFQWHQDTMELPPGAEPLASGDRIPVQAYRVGALAWATQFHFEIDAAELDLWVDEASRVMDLEEVWGKSRRPDARRGRAVHGSARGEGVGDVRAVRAHRRGAHGMTRPLVAVPAYHLASDRVARWPDGGYGVPAPYLDGLRRAGARTAIIAPGEEGDAAEILAPFDALLLVGGGDIDPARYGAEPDTEHNYGVEEDRDRFEIALLHAARRSHLPTLCICRGMQVLNVAFGGTLHQHLPAMAGLIPHGVPVEDSVAHHDVRSAADSRLRKAAGERPSCPARRTTTRGSTAWATAWWRPAGPPTIWWRRSRWTPRTAPGWMLGVQWHPEETAAGGPGAAVVVRSSWSGLVKRRALLNNPRRSTVHAEGTSAELVVRGHPYGGDGLQHVDVARHAMTSVAATRFGNRFPAGGTIGVCAPGPVLQPKRRPAPRGVVGVEGLSGRGCSTGCGTRTTTSPGAAEKRAADLNALFADPEVDVIQVLWGGTGAMQLLPHLDYDLIAAHPKALMGFSDITNLHVALRQETGLATFHGPGLGSMGIPERTAFTWDSAAGRLHEGCGRSRSP